MGGFWFGRRVAVGDLVELADGRRGRVERIAVSPYWPEERDGIERAYVVPLTAMEAQWADWVLPGELKRVHKMEAAAA